MPKVKELLSHEGKDHEFEIEKVDWKSSYENHAEIYIEAYCIYEGCEETTELHIDIDIKNKTTEFR